MDFRKGSLEEHKPHLDFPSRSLVVTIQYCVILTNPHVEDALKKLSRPIKRSPALGLQIVLLHSLLQLRKEVE